MGWPRLCCLPLLEPSVVAAPVMGATSGEVPKPKQGLDEVISEIPPSLGGTPEPQVRAGCEVQHLCWLVGCRSPGVLTLPVLGGQRGHRSVWCGRSQNLGPIPCCLCPPRGAQSDFQRRGRSAGVWHRLGAGVALGHLSWGEKGFSWPSLTAVGSLVSAPEDEERPLTHLPSLLWAGVSWAGLGVGGAPVGSCPAQIPKMVLPGRTCSALAAEWGCGRKTSF